MFPRQKDVYSRKIENVSKCTVVGGMILAFHHSWAYGLSKLTCVVSHSVGERD